jgi:hypothetical protein
LFSPGPREASGAPLKSDDFNADDATVNSEEQDEGETDEPEEQAEETDDYDESEELDDPEALENPEEK